MPRSVSTAYGPTRCITIIWVTRWKSFSNGTGEITIIGPDLVAGMRPQLLIPGGTFHTSRLQTLISAPTGFASLGTTEWPGFESADLELADPRKLITAYPTLRREIEAFTRTQGADSS